MSTNFDSCIRLILDLLFFWGGGSGKTCHVNGLGDRAKPIEFQTVRKEIARKGFFASARNRRNCLKMKKHKQLVEAAAEE